MRLLLAEHAAVVFFHADMLIIDCGKENSITGCSYRASTAPHPNVIGLLSTGIYQISKGGIWDFEPFFLDKIVDVALLCGGSSE